ncbi:MAG TPA: hypothetical protein VFJ17_11360 [Mycobacteriales bacterium]|nr:hypothetical protein [Mycobacteriales bacterium]
MILLAGAAAGALGVGWAAVLLGVAVFLLAARRGTLVTRMLVLLLLESALLIGAGFVGPFFAWAFAPPALGALVCVPAAVVVAASPSGVARRAPLLPVDDLAALFAGVVGALLVAKPLIGGSDVARLRAMTLGGSDFAEHFDYIQSVWFHRGFLFVSGGHRILEPRPDIAAAPHGVHVALSALGILLSGRSELPSMSALLRFFAWSNVLVDAALVVALTALTARLLRFVNVRPAIRVVAVLLVGSVAVVGAISTLYVWGFIPFAAGLTATVLSLVVAITARPGRSAADGAVVTAGFLVGGLTYTLMLPALLLAFGLFLLRTRSDWRVRSWRCWPIVAYVALVVGTLVFSILPVLPHSSAVSTGGGVTAAPLGLIVLVGLGTLVMTLAVRTLPSIIRELSALSLVLGALTLAFATEQLVTQGHIKYYALKFVYVWLCIALVAFVVELACLLDVVVTQKNLRLRSTAAIVCAGVVAMTGAGYLGQGTSPVLIGSGGATPLIVKWAFATSYMPTAAREEWTADRMILRALRVPGPHDRLLWGPRVLLPVHNRWLAVLNRSWDTRSDSLLLRLRWFRFSVTWQLKKWLVDHAGGPPLLLLVTKESWSGRAHRAVAEAGADYVQIRSLPDSATYQVPPTAHRTR